MGSTPGLALVLVLVLDEDVVLALEEGVDCAQALALAMVLALVLDEDAVHTQGHPDRRYHSRGTQ